MTHELSEVAREQMAEELAQLRAHLDATPRSEDFALSLLREQSEDRASALEAQLAGGTHEKFGLTFAPEDDPGSHSLSTTVLTQLLSR
jgi:hypothetical protein